MEISHAVSSEESPLQGTFELSEAVPEYGKVLIAIPDADASCVDATDHLTILHQEVVERKVPVRDHRIRREGKQLVHRSPDLLGGPTFPRLVEIVFIDQACLDPPSCEREPVAMIAVERTFGDRDRVEPPKEVGQRINDGQAIFWLRFQNLESCFSW